ncbi:MAG: DUF4870 domain-containing protein [Gammaproteobacteria bacterium]|nr:DUF4870 domain-containing protein [Gammaproteobacteria bacterium]
MGDRYDDLARLNELRLKGALTEEEYQAEKQKVLANPGTTAGGSYWGMEENQFAMLMHLAQFANFLLPFAGLILPIVMWSTYKEKSPLIDANGRNIINWLISATIYCVGAFVVCWTIIGLVIGIPVLFAIAIMSVVFTIIGAVKANKGEAWKYPLSIKFL